MDLISSAQDLTASWVDLGQPIDTTGSTRLGLYLNVDINDSQNARVRALAKLGKNDSSEYSFPIQTLSAADIKVEDEYFELNVDADQLLFLEIETKGLVPFVQLQVQAGVAGETAGQIDSAKVVLSSY